MGRVMLSILAAKGDMWKMRNSKNNTIFRYDEYLQWIPVHIIPLLESFLSVRIRCFNHSIRKEKCERRREMSSTLFIISLQRSLSIGIDCNIECYVEKYHEITQIPAATFEIFRASKGRQNVRGDKIWCEKWNMLKILHRHSAAGFFGHHLTTFLELRAWYTSGTTFDRFWGW